MKAYIGEEGMGMVKTPYVILNEVKNPVGGLGYWMGVGGIRVGATGWSPLRHACHPDAG